MLFLLICGILCQNDLQILYTENQISVEGGLLRVVSRIEADSVNQMFVYCVDPQFNVSSVALNNNTILQRSVTLLKGNCFDVPTTETRFTITATYLNALKPSPKIIRQSQPQTLLLLVNSVLFSPYFVRKQVTHINGQFIQHDLSGKYDATGRKLTFGPFQDIEPYTSDLVSAFFQSDDSLLSLSSYKRIVEISHWGYINVREMIELQSNSARIQDEAFSRLDYTLGSQRAPHVERIALELPHSASRLYFRDDIGNISTSIVDNSQSLQSKLLFLYFRFPLISGWRTQFEFGYQLPVYERVSYADGEYVFSDEIMSLLFPNQVVEDFELHVVMPPHVTHLRMDGLSFQVESSYVGEHSAYLDLAVPRKTFVIKTGNLNPVHAVDFKIIYNYNNGMLVVKPILLSLMFFFLYMSIIVFERLDFAILPARKEGLDVHHCAVSLCKIYEEIVLYCEGIQERLNVFKKDKDETAFGIFRQEFDEKIKVTKQKATTIEDELEESELSEDMGPVVGDVMVKSKEVRAQIVKLTGKISQLFVNVGKLLANSMTGKDYSAFEIKNIAERGEIIKSIENAINNL